jgi:hypothetical protein
MSHHPGAEHAPQRRDGLHRGGRWRAKPAKPMRAAPKDAADLIELEPEDLAAEAKQAADVHRNAAEKWSWAHLSLGIPATILGGTAAATGFADGALVAGISATGSTVLMGLVTSLKPRQEVSRHRKAYREMRCLQRDARKACLFPGETMQHQGEQAARVGLDALQARFDDIEERAETGDAEARLPKEIKSGAVTGGGGDA